MPINYSRRLTGTARRKDSNRDLGYVLAFVAGAINAAGFLAVHQYTSHMTGIVSSIADHLVLRSYGPVLTGLFALLAFVGGAACCALMVNGARRRALHSQFAMPLLLEAILLLGFGLLGARLGSDGASVTLTVMLLSFMMGLQNATITKISNTEIRTTHITGVVTDIGIELGKLAYWNGASNAPPVRANIDRLKMLALLALLFFIGGVTGALGFKHAGYVATLPLALVLIALAIAPVLDDLAAWRRPS
ncbi:MAG: YoaK family protein [Gammaproteobacteria bacterium]